MYLTEIIVSNNRTHCNNLKGKEFVLYYYVIYSFHEAQKSQDWILSQNVKVKSRLFFSGKLPWKLPSEVSCFLTIKPNLLNYIHNSIQLLKNL